MTSARPTAASAAATVMTKNKMICPSAVPRYRSTATNVKLTAFSMISIDSRIVIRFRRRKMPAVPMANSTADSIKYEFRVGSGMVARRFLSRDDDGADHRNENEHGRRLERERVLAEE